MTHDDLPGRVAAHYPGRFLRSYVHWKVRLDPVYAAVFDRVSGHSDPILDVGCGIGVLELYLRERRFRAPIVGVDHDERKIAMARRVVAEAAFAVGDARLQHSHTGTVVMLDLMHYFRSDDQSRILGMIARTATTVIIRDGVRDGSWRYRLTFVQEWLSRAARWLRAERLHFATRGELTQPFADFSAEVVPLYGRTPFNNYLFVFKRVSAGMTKE